ncbi:MAG: MFS transporter [Acidimicrobiales bacterium]
MPTVEIERRVDAAGLADLLLPREAPVVERPLGDGRFGLDHGPFDHYERQVTVVEPSPQVGEPGGEPCGATDDGHPTAADEIVVTERVEFHLALVGIWRPLFNPLVKQAIRKPPPPGKVPWWSPPEALDTRAARVLGLLCVFSLVAGYLGVLLSQTNTYFKAEFGASNSDISWILTGVRVGGLLALLIVLWADRRGRRAVLLFATYAGLVLAATGALAPSLGALGVSQTLARACSAAIALLVGIMAVEEMPSGSRAFAVSVLTMTGALGAGGVVVFLQLAELAPWAWRIFYLVPLLMIVPVVRLARILPETRRFEVHEAEDAGLQQAPEQPGTGITGMSHRRRFALIGSTSFLFAVFFTPASGFLNEFLRTEEGFNGLRISLLQVLTNLPGGVAIVVGGRLADAYGRRLIGAIGVAGGVGFTVAMYLGSGWSIWVFSALATLIGAMSVPALGVYGPELFPTSSRGLANGGINLLGVGGSVLGLLVAGTLADRWGSFSPTMLVLAVGPALVVLIVALLYPETAHTELEDLNPEDARPPTSLAGIAELEHDLAVAGVDPEAEHHGVGVPDADQHPAGADPGSEPAG